MKKKGKVITSSVSLIVRSKVVPCDPLPRFPPSWSQGEIDRSKESMQESWMKSSPLITPGINCNDLVACDVIPTVAVCSGPMKRIVELDASMNKDPGNPYHVRWPECREMEIKTAQDMHDMLNNLTETKILARSPLFTLVSNDQPMIHSGQIEATRAKPLCHWLSSQLPSVKEFSVSVEQVSSGTLLPLRYSTDGLLIIQVKGRQRTLLVPPSLQSLAPFSRSHPLYRYSAVGIASTASPSLDLSLVDHVASLWPSTSKISGVSCILSPGEALFVPPGYSIHRETMDTTASLIVNLKTNAPCSSFAAVLESASIIERWVDYEVGITSARRFLIDLIQIWKQHEHAMEAFVVSSISAVRSGRPLSGKPPRHWSEKWPLDTVKGYKLVRLSWEVYQVACYLVDSHAPFKKPYHFIEAVIEGRLLPTQWLDAYGLKSNHVPSAPHLSLAWSYPSPVLEQDEQTFPLLFRRQIELKESKASEVARRERGEKEKRLGSSINRLQLEIE